MCSPIERRVQPITCLRCHMANAVYVRCALLLCALCSVFGASLVPAVNTEGVVAAADHVVSHAWKISYTSATNEHDGVLLEVVAFAADVGGNFLAVGQANSSNLTKCRVWLLWRYRSYLKAHATLLRAGVEITYVRLGLWAASWVADKLIDRGHWDSISAAEASRAVYQDQRIGQDPVVTEGSQSCSNRGGVATCQGRWDIGPCRADGQRPPCHRRLVDNSWTRAICEAKTRATGD